jgi:hypothetical protein
MEKFLKNQPIPLTQVIDPNTGQVYYSPQNVVYDDKNGAGPTRLKNVIVDTSISSSYALTASYALNSNADTGSLIITASFTDPNLQFVRGDGSTFDVNLSTLTVINALTASYINGGTF